MQMILIFKIFIFCVLAKTDERGSEADRELSVPCMGEDSQWMMVQVLMQACTIMSNILQVVWDYKEGIID